MDALFPVLIVLALFTLAVAALSWSHSRSTSIIDQWAAQNGFTILSADRRYLRGPFFFRSDDNQTVYYVTLKDRSGQTRRAWIRCGGWFLGLMSDAIKVEWDS